MKETKAASRYAKSLLDLAIEKNILNAVVADIKLIQQVMQSNRDFVLLLNSPVVKTDKKENILKEIFAKNINALTLDFILLIANKKREAALPQIAEAFVALYDEYKGIQKVIVTTANGVDDVVRKRVLEIVRSANKSEIELVEKTDPSIIGGFILTIGDKQIDSSIVRSLKNLKKDITV